MLTLKEIIENHKKLVEQWAKLRKEAEKKEAKKEKKVSKKKSKKEAPAEELSLDELSK